MIVLVEKDKCVGSGECIKVCPQKAISIHGEKAVINQELCDQDGLCIPACPHRAIRLVEE